MDLAQARDAAMLLRWAAEHYTKYAILLEAGADTKGVLQLAENNLRKGVETAGFTIRATEDIRAIVQRMRECEGSEYLSSIGGGRV